MNNALLMRMVHGAGEGLDELCPVPGRQGPVAAHLFEAGAVHEFQSEIGQAVVLGDVVNLHDVWMLQARDRLRLGMKGGPLLWAGMSSGQDHLQGHHPFEGRLSGSVDDAHAAASQLSQDFITGESRPRRQLSGEGRGTRGERRVIEGLIRRKGKLAPRPSSLPARQQGGPFQHVVYFELNAELVGILGVSRHEFTQGRRAAAFRRLQPVGKDLVQRVVELDGLGRVSDHRCFRRKVGPASRAGPESVPLY